MAYIVQNSEKNYEGNSSSVNAVIPDVDVQIGDYIVFYGTISNSYTWSSVGYTNAGAFAGGNVGSSWLYKKVTALPEPNPTITMSGSQAYALVGFVVRDADPTTFLDDVGVNGYSTNTTSLQIPSVTAGNKSLLVTGVSSRGLTTRQFSQGLMNVAYPNGYLLVSSGYQESGGATPTIDITQLLNDRGAASIIAIKNKTGGTGGVSISGGPTYFMRGLDGLSGPTSLDTRRATINGKTVGTTVNMSASNSNLSGADGADFFTSTGISLIVSAGGSGVAGEQNGVVFNVPAGHDFSSDSLMFNYFLNSLDNNFQDDVAIYLEDGSGNWVVRRLYDQEDTNDILETYTHYGQFETNTDAYPIEDSSGVMDYSDVQWWGLTWENRITNTGNRNHNLYNFGHANNPLVFVGGGPSSILNDGGSINPRTITKGLSSGSKRRASAFSGLGQDVISESVQIGDGVTSTHYYAPFTNLEMQQRGGFKGFGFRREDRTMEFRIKTSASDVIDLSSSTISTPTAQDFVLDPTCSMSATYDFNGCTLSGFYVDWLAGLACNNVSFIGGYAIDGKSGTFDGCTFSSSRGTGSSILITSGASVTNCSFTKGNETYALEIDSAGTYDLYGSSFSGYTKYLNITAVSGTVTLNLALGDATPTYDTAGATVVINLPVDSLTFNNLVSSNVLIVDNLGTVVSYQTAQTGTYAYEIPALSTGTWTYCVNREGYEPLIATFSPVDTTVNVALREKLQPDGSAMYLASTSGFLNVVIVKATPAMFLDIADGFVTSQQIFDEVEDELMTQDGMEYLVNGGGEVSIASLATGNFVFIENDVRVRREDAGDANATINAFVQSTEGVVVDDVNGSVQFFTISDADQISSHQGAVWVDTGSANSGTIFPTGTSLRPVNNLSDAILIAQNLGLVEIKVQSTLTIDADVSGFRIGVGGGAQTLILSGSGNVHGCVISGFFVTGTQNGTVLMETCSLNNLSGLSGTYRQVAFGETFSVNPSAVRFNLLNCYSSVAGDAKPVCDMTGVTACEVNNRAWSGGWELANATSAGNDISIDVISGRVKLASSCTAGDCVVGGIGSITDESVGMTVNIESFNPNMEESEMHIVLDNYINKDDWKADVSGLSTFDASTDEVDLKNNAITSNKVASNAFNNSAFTTGFFNAINGEVDTALGDYDAPTKAEMDSAFASLNDLSTADIDARLTAYGLPTLTEMTSAFTEIKGAGWAATDTLEAIKDASSGGSSLTAEDVWTYVTRGLTEDVTTDSASRTASQADVSALATQASITSLNDLSTADVDARLTAYGIATGVNVSDAQTAVTNAISALNDLSSADVASEISTYDGPTKSELDSAELAITGAVTALNNLSASQVNAEVDTAMADYDGPTKSELDSAQSSIEALISALSTVANSIELRTNNLPDAPASKLDVYGASQL